MTELGFDLREVEIIESSGGELLPKGKYEVMLSDWEKKQSKSGNDMLVLEFTIIGEHYTNRKLWENLLLWHDNEQARNIARSLLKKLSMAAGVYINQFEDLDEIKAQVALIADVYIQKGKDGREDQNRIGGFENAKKAQPKAAEKPAAVNKLQQAVSGSGEKKKLSWN